MSDPIERIEWLPAFELKPNFWNPNVVFRDERRLIEHSILETGWIQPLLISEELFIIDGFHRWRIVQDSKKLQQKYGGLVPCARLQVTEAEAMLITVRINRAKGQHAAVRLSDLVRRLVDEHGYDHERIGTGIGASVEEVKLLYSEGVFEAKGLKDYEYSKAWVPYEDGVDPRKAGEA